ncbi:unnamed protein product [Schistosoma margrebowiei]|uniref:Uncharacterized protein n=1 Tax=Schistosoma margrebowiei TaxID=48269 RepID=A0A183N408_9TREM|nr:unnamed protein product [Schistosoma margrebowiei]
MVVGGNRLGTHQQGILVILRDLVLPDCFDPLSPSITLNNRFKALQDLVEQGETTIEYNQKMFKEALTSTYQKVLGHSMYHHKEWISNETPDKIREKKNKTTAINNNLTKTKKIKAQVKYTEANKPQHAQGENEYPKNKTENIKPIRLDGETLEDVRSFTYLNSIFDEPGGSDADINVRTDKARTALLQSKNIWKSKQLSTNIKVRIFDMNVNTVLLYGAETWRTTTTIIKKLFIYLFQHIDIGTKRHQTDMRHTNLIRYV